MYDNNYSLRRSPAVRSSADRTAGTADRQLLVVSNRQPYSHDYGTDGDGIVVDRPTGGLTEGLDPLMQEAGGTWIAWGDGDADREVVDANDAVPVPPEDPRYRLKRVWLSDEQVHDYYYGYSNRVLWPLCHGSLATIHGEPAYWEAYCRTNEHFAEAVCEAATNGSLVWFQDYHLALAPRLVRQSSPGATLLHFWHIPWPAWDTFRAAPNAVEIVDGLLANDLLGFHVPRYVENFLECVDAVLETASVDWPARTVSYQGHRTRVTAIPLGVPFQEIRQRAGTPAAEAFWSSFTEEHGIDGETRVAVGVDRLDYTKGIPERLRGLERFWERYPDWRGSLTYVQNGSESRSKIPEYRALQESVAETVDRINRRFGTESWQPIVYTTDRLSPEELCGLYRYADLALVTPIRDGMNLVAQEYVAAQLEQDGVLVLSDQTGAHDEYGDHAVSVSPLNVDDVARAIAEALAMAPREQRYRMGRLQRQLSENDLDAWVGEHLRLAPSHAVSQDRHPLHHTP